MPKNGTNHWVMTPDARAQLSNVYESSSCSHCPQPPLSRQGIRRAPAGKRRKTRNNSWFPEAQPQRSFAAELLETPVSPVGSAGDCNAAVLSVRWLHVSFDTEVEIKQQQALGWTTATNTLLFRLERKVAFLHIQIYWCKETTEYTESLACVFILKFS